MTADSPTSSPRIRYRVAVLASGRGSNLRALHAAFTNPAVDGELGCVVGHRKQSGALTYAQARGIPHRCIAFARRPIAEAEAEIVDFLRLHEIDYVALAGYLKLVGATLLAAYPRRILNIHPGPLPRFGGQGMYGPNVHEAVLSAGQSHSGPTVHLVDENFDEGQILAHVPVPVRADDTASSLAARVLAEEHRLYARAVEDYHHARLRHDDDQPFVHGVADAGG